MATKYQDSTPQRTIWKVGQPNKNHTWQQWGYDTTLFTFKVDENITGGSVVFEGYCGFQDEDGTTWGDWWQLAAKDVYYGHEAHSYEEYGLSQGSAAFWVRTVGFSQIRCRLDTPLEGEGQVQVVLACHAV